MLLVENVSHSQWNRMVSLDASFSFFYLHIKSSGRVLETSKLKPQPRKGCYNVRNSQLNTPPYFATSHYFIYRNYWADLMYSSMKPAHDPQAIQHGAGREMKGPPSPACLIGIYSIIEQLKCYLTQQQKLGETDRERTLSYLQTPRMRSLVFGRNQPLLPLGRVSLLSELAGRGDRLINMHIES